jgi:hypothetical protein
VNYSTYEICKKLPQAFSSIPIAVLDYFGAANEDDEISHVILVVH